MGEFFFIIYVISIIWGCRDVMKKLSGSVERFLWIVCIVAVPVLGAAFWYHVQYQVIPEKRRLTAKRKAKAKLRREKKSASEKNSAADERR